MGQNIAPNIHKTDGHMEFHWVPPRNKPFTQFQLHQPVFTDSLELRTSPTILPYVVQLWPLTVINGIKTPATKVIWRFPYNRGTPNPLRGSSMINHPVIGVPPF